MKQYNLLLATLFFVASCFVRPPTSPCEGGVLLGDSLCYSLQTISEERSFNLEAGDFNGDSFTDLLESAQSGEHLWLNDGAGFFRLSGDFPFQAHTADLNSDSFSDMFFLSFATSEIVLQLNQQNGQFGPISTFETGTDDPLFVRTDDLDLDGDMDLVVVGNPDSGAILLNDGSARFSLPSPFVLPLQTVTDVILGDLNQDLFPDFVYGTENAVCLLFNNGAAAFLSNLCSSSDSLGFSGRLRLVDLNRDQRLDIVGAQVFGLDIFAVLNLTETPSTPLFNSPAFFTLDNFPQVIAVSDLDLDGFDDLLLTQSASEQIDVWLNQENSILTPTIPLPVPDTPNSILPSDLNQDSLSDLAVSTDSGLFILLSRPLFFD